MRFQSATMTPHHRALIYVRVSTDRQANKGIALPTQEEACRKLAEDRGYRTERTTDLYVDGGESATSMNRPALLDLLNRAKEDKAVGAVVVYDVSRLARNRLDFAFIKQALKKRGIALLSATEPIDETPEGQMLEGVLSTVAEFFSAQSGRKVSAGMRKKAEQGGWPNLAPYGYQNRREKLPSGEERSWIEPHPIESRWVRRAFELFATGQHSLKGLARKLEDEGIVVRRSAQRRTKRFHHTQLERLLQNRIYIGVIEWAGIVNEDGAHEPLASPSLFYRVQDLLLVRKGRGTRKRRHFSVLKGISFCGECGSRLTIDLKQTSTTKSIRYFRCLKARAGKRVPCSQHYHREDEYLADLERLLQRIELPVEVAKRLRAKLRKIFTEETAAYTRSRDSLLAQLDAVKRRRKNLVLKELDVEPADLGETEVYRELKQDLAGEERRLEDDLARLDYRLEVVEEVVDMALAITASCHYAYTSLKDHPELQGLLVQTIFKDLRLRDGRIVEATLREPLAFIHNQRDDPPLNHRGDLCLLSAPNSTVPEGVPQSPGAPSFVEDERDLRRYLERLPELLDSMQIANVERCYAALRSRRLLRLESDTARPEHP